MKLNNLPIRRDCDSYNNTYQCIINNNIVAVYGAVKMSLFLYILIYYYNKAIV